jgi:XisI protein
MGANDYRAIVRRIIEQETVGQPSHGKAEVIAICDDASGNYLAMVVGWSSAYRHDHIFIHLRLKDGKVWIEHNGTEEDLVERLVEAGVLREDIVPGFIHRPER